MHQQCMKAPFLSPWNLFCLAPTFVIVCFLNYYQNHYSVYGMVPIVNLIWFLLMTNNVEHFFMCLLSVHVSSSITFILKYFVHCWIELSYDLYILEIWHLSDKWFINNFSCLWFVFSFFNGILWNANILNISET